MDLTTEQIADLRNLRMTTDLPDEELAERFGVPVNIIQRHTMGIQRQIIGPPSEPEPDEDATDKTERQLHKEMLEALKAVGIGPKQVAEGLKKMLGSADMQDVRDGVKELNRIMGVYSKEKAAPATGAKVFDKQYELKLPKRKED